MVFLKNADAFPYRDVSSLFVFWPRLNNFYKEMIPDFLPRLNNCFKKCGNISI